jgi:hypothetical protein
MIQLMKGDAFDLNRPYIWHRIRSVADRFMNAKIIEVLPSSPPYDNFREMIAYVSKYRQNVLDVSQYRWKITHRRLEALRDLGCLDVLVIDGIKIPLRLNPDGISSKKLTVIDEYHWNQYVDLKKYGISFEGVPPIKEIASRISQNIGHQNCTIIRIPNGLTLDSCIRIALPFFKFKSQICSRSLVPSGVFIFPNQNTDVKDPSMSPCIAHCVLYSYFSFLTGKKSDFKSLVDETKSKVYYGVDGKAFSTVTKYQFQSDSNKLRMSVTVAN